MAHPDIGQERLNQIAKNLEDIAQVQTPPKMNGRQMTMLLNPDKRKIDALKRQAEKDKQQTDGEEGADSRPPPPSAEAAASESGASPS